MSQQTRNEVQAIKNKYNAVLRWEEEFAKEIEELNKIEESDIEANKIAIDILKAWDDRKSISGKRINLSLSSNAKRIKRLESKLREKGYELLKEDFSIETHINKLA
ncbi:hypothetical protein ACFVQB_14860 [Paenibacillus sp. NPDC057886]|uniref:hypothetical protein n=1 Tax=Paenibacillus sp. NPDC057886 TaxID=3346270 RepID=UPI0036766CAF